MIVNLLNKTPNERCSGCKKNYKENFEEFLGGTASRNSATSFLVHIGKVKLCYYCVQKICLELFDEYDLQGMLYEKREKNKKEQGIYTKKPVPYNLRWAVFERDGFQCKHCGVKKYLTVDHVIPESKGGELTLENCQTLCRSCNSKKGTK